VAARALHLIAGTSYIPEPKKHTLSSAEERPIARVIFSMGLAYEITFKCLEMRLNSSWLFKIGIYFYSLPHMHNDFLQVLHIMPPTILLKS
jgi:hypothetical protein